AGSFSNSLSSGATATTTFYNGGIVFSDGTKLTQAAGSGNGIFSWDNTNNRLAIGTSTPIAQLSINQTAGSGPALVIGSSTSTSLIVDANGNVGIGKSSPGNQLDVSGSVSISSILNVNTIRQNTSSNVTLVLGGRNFSNAGTLVTLNNGAGFTN